MSFVYCIFTSKDFNLVAKWFHCIFNLNVFIYFLFMFYDINFVRKVCDSIRQDLFKRTFIYTTCLAILIEQKTIQFRYLDLGHTFKTLSHVNHIFSNY